MPSCFRLPFILNLLKELIVMKRAYTAVLSPREDSGYNCCVPDLPGCITSGADIADAVDMITDAANLWMVTAEDCGDPIPAASAPGVAPHADGDVLTVILIDTAEYRARIDNRAVRKNVSLPAWMATMAERRGVNCSQVLQDALRQILA